MQDFRPLEQPWRRLIWEAPVALLLTGIALASFTRLLQAPPPPPAEQKPVTAQLIELPPPPVKPVVHPAPKLSAPANRPAPAQPKAPPPPPKPVAPPRPVPAPPKPTTPPSAPVAPKPAPVKPAPPPKPAPAPQPAANGHSLPGGGSMGARAIVKPMPEIPDDLAGQEIHTTATAQFHVAADGSAQVDLVQPTADPRLNAAILQALKRWRFFPAMQDGHPVASTLTVTIPIDVQ